MEKNDSECEMKICWAGLPNISADGEKISVSVVDEAGQRGTLHFEVPVAAEMMELIHSCLAPAGEKRMRIRDGR